EVLPVRPVRDEIAVRDEDTRCVLMGTENTDRLAGLDEQRLVGIEVAQGGDDAVERIPAPGGLADAAVDDEVIRALGDIGNGIVHHAPQRSVGKPALRWNLGAARRADSSGVRLGSHGVLPLGCGDCWYQCSPSPGGPRQARRTVSPTPDVAVSVD